MENNVRFLNIEYVFNRIFDAYLWVKYFYVFKIQGTTQAEYLASKNGVEYDGIRDRFGLDDPYSSIGGFGHNTGGVNISSDTSDGSGLSFIFKKIFSIFNGGGTASVGSSVSQTSGGLVDILSGLRDLMTLLALVIITIYIYSLIRWKEVVAEYFEKYKKSHNPPVMNTLVKNSKWATIEKYIESNDEAQWRLAILEADIMLDNLLKTLPIPGTDVGEKLTNADRKNFQTLEDAWEAHKVRNRIAHDGTSYFVTEHLARKTIQQFKNVFTEFDYGLN